MPGHSSCKRMLLFAFLLICPQGQASILDDIKQLPEGEGKTELISNCSGCHSLKLVLQNRMTRQAWDATITWMQKEQNLWPLAPKLRKSILDYLATHLAPSGPEPGNPFLPRPVNPLPENVYLD